LFSKVELQNLSLNSFLQFKQRAATDRRRCKGQKAEPPPKEIQDFLKTSSQEVCFLKPRP